MSTSTSPPPTPGARPSLRSDLLPSLCGVALAVAASYAINTYAPAVRAAEAPPRLYSLKHIPGTELADQDLASDAHLVFDPNNRGECWLTSTILEDIRDRR